MGGPGDGSCRSAGGAGCGGDRGWNEVTERTLAENAQPIFQSILYYGFTALAMYDAVVTIEGGFVPWSRLPRAHAHASAEVAAATAAYRVLRHYFPDSTDNLTADYEATLAALPNGVGKVHGVRVCEAGRRR